MNNKKTLVGFLILFLGILVFFLMRGKMINDLKDNGVIVNAKIIEVLAPPKGGVNVSFRCEFNHNGVLKKLISASNIRTKPSTYIGHIYPALYSEKSDKIRLLLTEEDYKEYNQQYSDSQIKKYIE